MANEAKTPEKPSKEKQAATESQIPAMGAGAAGLFARLAGKVPASWRRYVGVALIVAFALLIVGVMRNYAAGVQASRQEQLFATAQALAQPTIDATTGGEAGALMPSFSSAASPFSAGISRKASLDTTIPSRPRVEIITYTVAQGDTLFAIADKYTLKPESILWFNFEELGDNPALIQPGLVLNIPPVDGVLHKYKSGESLAAIADFYSYSTEPTAQDIIEWPGNGLDPYETNIDNPGIPDGTLVIVPNGSRELRDWGPPAVTRDNPAVAAYYGAGACGAIFEGAIGNGSFVWPTSLKYLSGNDYDPNVHRGIDIAGAEGNPIYATDSGVVVYAGGSNYGYGNLLVIDHGNGWQSAYAHLSTIAVSCGMNVGQGEVVAAVGNSGNSSGPHLHFELNSAAYGKVNPWDFLVQ